MSSLEAMQLGFVSTAVAFGLYHIVTMQLLCFKVKEKVQQQRSTLPLVSSVMRSLNNAAFRPLLGAPACPLSGVSHAGNMSMGDSTVSAYLNRIDRNRLLPCLLELQAPGRLMA